MKLRTLNKYLGKNQMYNDGVVFSLSVACVDFSMRKTGGERERGPSVPDPGPVQSVSPPEYSLEHTWMRIW